MGYWYASDLAQYVVQPGQRGTYTITGSSVPVNATQFQEIIEEVSGAFDQAAAKAGYLVPIPTSATQAWLVAKRVVRNGAIADALRIIYTGPDQKYVDKYEMLFQNALVAIAAGDRPLPGAPNDTGSGNRLFPQFGGIASPVMTSSYGIPNDLGGISDF